MMAQARHGMIIGAVVGAALGAFMFANGSPWFMILIMTPIGAVMGAAPWLLKPKQE
jgi:F0F1-type ATP synthase assembly protein I